MNLVKKRTLPSLQIKTAKTFFQRAVGLLGRSQLRMDEGLYFPNTRSVHTVGMRFAIDIVYVNECDEIVEIHQSLQPFRISWCFQAHSLYELAQGAVSELSLQKGQKWPMHLYN
jgi:uncharacterized protein